MEILAIEPEIEHPSGVLELRQVRGTVEFKAVGFRYHERQTHILKNISLTLQAGEYVALVGTFLGWAKPPCAR